MTILPSGPDGVKFEKPWKLDYTHPCAVTFCVLEEGKSRCVLVHHSRPHLYVYNALKKCDPAADVTSWKIALAAYGVEKVAGRLTPGMLAHFRELSESSHGFPRYVVRSGRVWRGLKALGGGRFHVMTLWTPGAVSDGTPALVVKALKMRGPVFLGEAGKEGCWVNTGILKS